MKKGISFLLPLLFCLNSFCQNASHLKDSLVNVLKTSKDDTSKVLLLYNIGNTYEDNKIDSAIYYYTVAGNLSKKLNYKRGDFKYITNITAVLNLQNNFDSSLSLNMQSVAIAKELKDPSYLAIAYNNIAASYYNIKDFEKCVEYLLKAVSIFESMNDMQKAAFIYSNLAGIYSDMDQSEKGYQYGLKAIIISRPLNDLATLKGALTNTTGDLLSLKKFDTALILCRQALALAKTTDDNWVKCAISINMAGIYNRQMKYELMLQAAEQAIQAAGIIGNAEATSKGFLFKALYLINNKKFVEARPFVDTAISIATKNDIRDALRDGYKYRSYVEFGVGNIAAFHKDDALYDSVGEVLFSDKILKNTQELETRYKVEKKQAEINDLTKEKEIQKLTISKRNTLNWILGGIILFAALIGFLSYKSYNNKKKLLLANTALQQQRIIELENEKLLTATRAIVQGQEEERTRLAKDLHDGLGGILSSTKYSLGNMRQNLIITPENALAFERTMDMLDQSIKELRRVAHNMMPETLMKLSLSEALQDYCMQVTQSGALKVSYQNYGTEELTLENSVKITVYRIIQELVNNAIKHADAQTAAVQLICNENKLNITVEDDGKGFDKALLENASGIGYKNLQSRVDVLKGTIDIQSELNKGTSVYIEIPLP